MTNTSHSCQLPEDRALTLVRRLSDGLAFAASPRPIYWLVMSAIRFGTDGWRGVIADDFTFDNVRRVAYAIARYIVRAEQPSNGVLIGFDNRFAGERFAQAAAEVVAMTGTPVWLAAAPCPSPAISLLVRQRRAAGGIMITASHNPARWNGIKFKASYGSSALPSTVAQIEQELAIVLGDLHKEGCSAGVPKLPARDGEIHSLDVLAPYLDTVEKLVDWERLRAAKPAFRCRPDAWLRSRTASRGHASERHLLR